MTAHRCACGQPAPDATICQACTRDLTAALVAVIALGPDLDIALARQAVLGDHTPARGHSAPLPYDERVAEVADRLDRWLRWSVKQIQPETAA